MKKAKQILSVLLAVFMVLSAVPVAFAAGDGEQKTVEISDTIPVQLGSDPQDYDEDGYILTGDSYASIFLYEPCSVTFDNLTASSFHVDGADRSVNVVLKGENNITYVFEVGSHDFEISAVDGATLAVQRMYTSGYDGTVTVNSGTVNIAPESEVSAAVVDCRDFIVNGGTVTASNGFFDTVNGPVHLNGGELNVINTSTEWAAIEGTITMKKGALLTVSATSGMLHADAEIVMADGAAENDSFFVRYDTESEFAPVADIKAALDNKTYAEIKIDTHAHSYTDGICGCGYVCTHDDFADGECPDCGAVGALLKISMYDSYGDGWNGNKLLIKNTSGEEIGVATFDEGYDDTYTFLLAEDVIFTLTWQEGSYADECTFEVAVDGETVFESERGDNYENDEVVYIYCDHEFVNSVCTKCGKPCLHDTDNGECSLCGKYLYVITHQPTEAEPYVELNDDTDASYQWYKVEGIEEITEENADTVSYDWGDSSYDAETGWTGVLYDEGSDEYDFFTVALHAGDTVKVELTGDFYDYVGLYDYATDEGFYEEVEPGINTYEITVTDDGNYTFYTYVDSGAVTVKAYMGDLDCSAIEGETEAALSNPAYSNRYLCEVTFADGTTEKSDILDLTYRITHQPTEAEPYVELNNDTDASYQWYVFERKTVEITDENATAVTPDLFDESEDMFTQVASYDAVNGWSSTAISQGDSTTLQYYFIADLKAGDVVNVTFSAAPEACNLMMVNDVVYADAETEDGINYAFTVPQDGMYGLLALCNDLLYAKASMLTDVGSILEGETDARLQNPEIGNVYFCEVTFADGTTKKSDILDLPYRITHQPTEAEPYVELNDDTDASYQWYEIEYGTIEITDENATVMDGDIRNADYVPGEGWQVGLQYHYVEGHYLSHVFERVFEAGDQIILDVTTTETDPELWLGGISDDTNYVGFKPDENGRLCATVELTDSYQLFSGNLYDPDMIIKAYLYSKNTYVELEGETDARLQNPEFGAEYYCAVTFADGTTEKSDILDLTYRITHQPTEAEPYVELNNDTDASYQWYVFERKTVEITDENATALTPEFLGMPEDMFTQVASYDAENGWQSSVLPQESGNGLLFFIADLKAGDVVNVTFSAAPDDSKLLTIDGDKIADAETEDGINYSFTVLEDGLYGLQALCNELLSAKASMLTDVSSKPEGETDARLQSMEYGKKYFCEVTFADGTTEESDILDLTYRITHQPTAGEPYVELNDDTDASYQWHEIEYGTIEITDENATVLSGDIRDAEYVPGEGWYIGLADPYPDGTYTIYAFERDFEAGDQIILDVTTTQTDYNLWLGGDVGIDSIEFMPDENGRLCATVAQDGTYGLFSGNVYDTDMIIKASLYSKTYVALESQTDARLQNPEFGAEYLCEVTFADGTSEVSDAFEYKYAITHQPTEEEPYVELNYDTDASYQWHTVEGGIAEITDEKATGDWGSLGAPSELHGEYDPQTGWTSSEGYYFVIELQEGETVELEASESVSEWWIAYAMYPGMYTDEWTVEQYGTTISFTATADGYYGFSIPYIYGVAVRAYMDGSVYTAIDGQTTDTLTPDAIGHYACKVTFADGTTEMSDAFEVTSVHTCDFSGDWVYDNAKHWKECTVDGCNAVSEETEHEFLDGECTVCDYVCDHANATAETIRPVQNADGTWGQGSIVTTCPDCENVDTEYVNRADYTAFDAAVAKLQAILAREDLIDGPKAGYTASLNTVVNGVGYNKVVTEQGSVNNGTGTINGFIAALEAGLADNTMKKADLSYMTALLDEVNALIDRNLSNIIPSESGRYTGPYGYYMAAINNGNYSQADYDRRMAEYDYENQLETLIAGLKDGSMRKADYTEIDEVIAGIDEALKTATVSDEMQAELDGIKKELDALKSEVNTSAADLANSGLLDRAKAIAETMNNCANGVHSFTTYEEVTSPDCDDAGKEVAVCDNGCGATDEKAIDALGHTELPAVKENEVAADCENEGSYDLVVYCDVCGEEISRVTETVDALGHSFTLYTVTVAPTCEEAGKQISVCDNGCGATDEQAVSALGHSFTKYVSNNDASCEADGTKTAHCDNGCGKINTVTDKGSKLDHVDANGDDVCDDCHSDLHVSVEDCECTCHHTDFFNRFVYKILQFIRKLFGINSKCDCGTVHTEGLTPFWKIIGA